MKKLLFPVALLTVSVAVGALAGCDRPLPGGVTQHHGGAPLIVDLDTAVGSQSTSGTLVLGTELQFTVRGANKGHGEVGGATATFIGNGGPMCVILDPEDTFDYKGANPNNGDSDLYVGRASDYNGMPGVTIGDFTGAWVDPLGISHPLDEDLCVQLDLFGQSGAHAGMGEPEFCTIQTDAGTPYIVLAKTFAVPDNDDLLTEAMRVDNGGCPAIDENTLKSDNGVAAGFAGPPAYIHQ